MSFLKPKQAKSSSMNVNNDLIKSTYGGTMQAGTGATNFMSQLLGVSPGDQGQAGFNQYLQQAGYAPAMRQLSQGITGQGAASGLLNSGATAKALQSRGTELNQGFFNNYLQQLQQLSGQGLQAGGLVANTGQQSTSKGGGPSTLGSIASTVGGIASIFSDRRLKTDIEKIDEFGDGLGIYSWRYIWGGPRHIGPMAQDVARLRPWALAKPIAGYQRIIPGAL